jgi:hypothetical protein
MWVDLWEVEAAQNAWRRIGELFVEKSLITGEELEQALAVRAAAGRPLGEVLVSEGLISSPEMTEVIMEQVGRKVVKEEGFGSPVWSEVQRQASRVLSQRRAAASESAAEPNQLIAPLARHLADAQSALDRERAAHEFARAEAAASKEELSAAEERIRELTAIVDRLHADRDERLRPVATWRRAVALLDPLQRRSTSLPVG